MRLILIREEPAKNFIHLKEAVFIHVAIEGFQQPAMNTLLVSV